MASAIYPKAKEAMMSAAINLPSVTLRVVMVDTTLYTYSDTHQYLSSIVSGARVATSPVLSSVTVTNGVLDALDVVFTAPTGATVNAFVVYVDTGTAATSRLLAYLDSAASGLPFSPNGTDALVVWDNAGNGIFKL